MVAFTGARVQVSQGLLALFINKYVHLDLKDDNVVVREASSPSEPPHAVVRAHPQRCDFWCMLRGRATTGFCALLLNVLRPACQ